MQLYCVKAIVKESQSFELAHQKKEKHFGHLAPFWFRSFTMLFHTSGHVVGHENTPDEWHIVIKAYRFTVFEI